MSKTGSVGAMVDLGVKGTRVELCLHFLRPLHHEGGGAHDKSSG